MNYFIYNYKGIFAIINIIIFILAFFVFFFTAFMIDAKFKFGKMKRIIFTIIIPFLCFILTLFAYLKIKNIFDYGAIKKMYITEFNNKKILSIWFIRVHGKRVGHNYDQTLKTFDLETGKLINSAELSRGYYDNDYRIYKSSKNLAWGHSYKTGLQLLDISIPKIIADSNIIKEKNPQITGRIKHLEFQKQTDLLYFTDEDNKTYSIDFEMKTKLIDNIPYYNEKKEINNWKFYSLDDNLGMHMHLYNDLCSNESAVLLKPEFIKTLSPGIYDSNKAWVMHKSSIYDKYQYIISYIQDDGKEINRINLGKLFKNNKAKGAALLKLDNQIIIFISMGSIPHMTIDGFNLTALYCDINSGEIVKMVKYFK